jgi:hypothetical protein
MGVMSPRWGQHNSPAGLSYNQRENILVKSPKKSCNISYIQHFITKRCIHDKVENNYSFDNHGLP